MGYIQLRRGRRSIPGQRYLVTFATSGRQPYFSDADVAMETSRLMSAPCAWPHSQLLAWVLMPDHWHGLVELGDETLSLCVARLKAMAARTLRQSHCEMENVWEPGYHDRAIRKSEDVTAAARYIVMNPVRAGIVRRVGDYPYWDAVWIEKSSRLKPLPQVERARERARG